MLHLSLFRDADITGQSLPVLRACGRILFIPLSVPPHKLETEFGRHLCRGHSAERLLLKRKSQLEEIQLLGYDLFMGVIHKDWPVISDYLSKWIECAN